MSSQPSESQGDRRRRRSGPRGAGPTGQGTEPREADLEAQEGAEESAPASRTLFNLLEPSLDAFGSFGAAIVMAGIVGLVAGVSVVAFVGSMRTYGYIDIAIGGGLIVTVALISFSSVVAAFFSRTGRYGVNAAIMVAAFTGIIMLINFVSFDNNRRTDVTATNQFSLAGGTKQLLKDLDEPVRATAFYPEIADSQQDRLARRLNVEETFREFEATRSSKFRFRFIDPTLEPDVVRNYFGATPTPFITESIVVEGMNSSLTHVIQPTDAEYSELEQDLYTSILVVSGRQRKAIYFLAGHGERDILTSSVGQNPAADGYDSVRAGLEGDNYEVRTLHWDQLDEEVSVPDQPAEGCDQDVQECLPGAALLVIAGPTDELTLPHAQALELFLRGKKIDEGGNLVDRLEAGRLIFLAEPEIPNTFVTFMALWGVAVGQGYIRDEARSVPNLPHTIQLQTDNPLDVPAESRQSIDPAIFNTVMEIVAPKGRSLGAIRMPGAAPVLVLNNPNFVSVVALASTSNDSYFIDDLSRTDPVKGSGDEADPKGPFSPIWYVQTVGPVSAPAPTARPDDNEFATMVVFGDSDFINNANYNVGSGADIFLNSANYLVGDYSLVSIRPKALTFREFNLDRNEYNFVRFSSWLFMPGLMGLMAAFVWWVRR